MGEVHRVAARPTSEACPRLLYGPRARRIRRRPLFYAVARIQYSRELQVQLREEPLDVLFYTNFVYQKKRK